MSITAIDPRTKEPAKHDLPLSGFVRLTSILAPHRTDSSRPVDVVGRRQVRSFSKTGEARAAHDRLEGRGHPRPDRKGELAMARRPNGRRVKIHRSYKIAPPPTFSACTSIPFADGSRLACQPRTPRDPSSSAVKTFVPFCMRANRSNRNVGQANSTAWAAGAQRPALDMAEYRPRTGSRGLLSGICPTANG